jgi:hypothetical protein
VEEPNQSLRALVRAMLEELGPRDLRYLAERLAPYLPPPAPRFSAQRLMASIDAWRAGRR